MKKVSIHFLIVFLLFYILPLRSETLENKLKAIKKKEENQTKLKKKNLEELLKLGADIEYEKDREKLAGAELNKLEQDINIQNKSIAEIESKINETDSGIFLLRENITGLNLKLTQNKTIFFKRLKAIFKEKKKNDALKNNILLSSSTGSSGYYKHIKFSNMIANRDKVLINDIHSILDSLQSEEKNLENYLFEKKKLLSENEKKVEILKNTKLQKENLVRKIKDNQKLMAREIEIKKRQMKIIDAAISALLSEKTQTQKMLELSNLSFKSLKGKLPWPIKKGKKNKIIAKFSETDDKYRYLSKTDGIEIRCEMDEPVLTVAAGQIQYADWFEGFGWTVIIAHGDGYFTLYMHLNEISVKSGDSVKTLEQIGKAGDSGSLSGISLMFQIREHKKTVNPELWLAK